MAKQTVVDVINATLGRYVSNIDAESLGISLWSGRLDFPKGLELNADAINREALMLGIGRSYGVGDVKLVSGRVDGASLEVPWRSLASKPVVLNLSGVRLVLESSPRHDSVTLPRQAKRNTLENQVSSLIDRRLEIETQDELRIKNEALIHSLVPDGLDEKEEKETSSKAQGQSEKETFRDRLTRRIVENLQLKITDVHAQFQEKGALGRSGFSTGLVLKSVSLDTTDEKGNHTFVDRQPGHCPFLYKSVRLVGLGIYLDAHHGEIRESIRRDEHNYILSPFSFIASLRQSVESGKQLQDQAIYSVTSKLPLLSIKFTREQLELANNVVSSLDSQEAKPLFPEYRPTYPIQAGTAKLWWQYAVRCIKRLSGRNAWPRFMEAFRKRSKYVSLYKRARYHPECAWLKDLSKEEEVLLQGIEDDVSISVKGIVMWRALAEGHVEVEKQKYLSKSENKATMRRDSSDLLLTVNEMKALDAQLEHMSETGTSPSADYKLTEIKFMLESFRLLLVSQNSDIMHLRMDVIESFLATTTTGKLSWTSSLSHISVYDDSTPGSLFPAVVRNVRDNETDEQPLHHDLFRLELQKSANGDQSVTFRGVCLEMVASPNLLEALKQFFTLQSASNNHIAADSKVQHPKGKYAMVDENSPHGEIDFFYDAQDGAPSALSTLADGTKAAFSDSVSTALVKAWRAKEKKQNKWIVDCEIDAPVIVVPESCTDEDAVVLIFDLGYLSFVSLEEPKPIVKEWGTPGKSDVTKVESWKLEIENLIFLISTAGAKDWRVTYDIDGAIEDSYRLFNTAESIVGPFSIKMDIGYKTSDHNPYRIFFDALIPQLAFRISPQQVSKINSVYSRWTATDPTVVASITNAPEPEPEVADIKSVNEWMNALRHSSQIDSPGIKKEETSSQLREDVEWLRASMAFRKISFILCEGNGDSFDAHMVHARVSLSSSTLGSKYAQIQMGWFWLLDKTNAQRLPELMMHTSFPQSLDLTRDDKHEAICSTLEEVGAFDDEFKGSAEGADITFFRNISGTEQNTTLEASYSRLIIHWRVRAVEKLLSLKGEFMRKLSTTENEDQTSRIGKAISSNSDTLSLRTKWRDSLSQSLSQYGSIRFETRNNAPRVDVSSSPSLVYNMTVRAKMSRLAAFFYPRNAGEPLFHFTMAETRAEYSYSGESSTEASFEVGDLRVESLASNSILPQYRKILGLAPNTRKSLVCAHYYQGGAVVSSGVKCANLYDACATIDLSLMKFVYLQSEVLGLLDYMSQGVLGTLTTKAANSAKIAAHEVAKAVAGDRLYRLTADGIEVVIPQSSDERQFFAVQISDIGLHHTSFGNSDSKSTFELHGLSLSCGRDESIIPEKIIVNAEIDLSACDGEKTADSSAKADIKVSPAVLCLTQKNITQILNTFKQNLSMPVECDDKNRSSAGHCELPNQDEAAIVESTEIKSGTGSMDMSLRIEMERMDFNLFGGNEDEPLLRFSASKSKVVGSSFAEANKWSCDLTLSTFELEDVRSKSMNQFFRHLMRHSEDDHDIFQLAVAGNENGLSSVDLMLDAVEVVVLPGFAADVFQSVSDAWDHANTGENTSHSKDNSAVDVDGEIMQLNTLERAPSTVFQEIRISLELSRFRAMMVDLCPDPFAENVASPLAFVFQGSLQVLADARRSSDGKLLTSSVKLKEERLQIFNAYGPELLHPVQILEPTNFSVDLKYSVGQKGEVKILFTSAVDIFVSIREGASFCAILSNTREAFSIFSKETTPDASAEEATSQILSLASALETDEKSQTESISEVVSQGVIEPCKLSAPQIKDSIASIDLEKSSEIASLQFDCSVPTVALILVNDAHGLEQALFKIRVKDVESGGQLKLVEECEDKSYALFDYRFSFAVRSDYYDVASNRWENFLIEPWKISVGASRQKAANAEREGRLASVLDIKAKKCLVSFTEQFMASVAAANENVFYTRSRETIAVAPYCLNNLAGCRICYEGHEYGSTVSTCESGQISYFNFRHAKGNGVGGKRIYGQDSSPKLLNIGFGDDREMHISIENVDEEINVLSVNRLPRGLLYTAVLNPGRLKVINVRTQVVVHNSTNHAFSVGIREENRTISFFGVCQSIWGVPRPKLSAGSRTFFPTSDPYFDSVRYPSLGIPCEKLVDFSSEKSSSGLKIVLCSVSSNEVSSDNEDESNYGVVNVPPISSLSSGYVDAYSMHTFDVHIRSSSSIDCEEKSCGTENSMVVQASIKVTRIYSEYLVDVYIQPRLVLRNDLPFALWVRTLDRNTYSMNSACLEQDDAIEFPDQVTHKLEPKQELHVLSGKDLLKLSLRTACEPLAGISTGWLEHWVSISLGMHATMQNPVKCLFPIEGGVGYGGQFLVSEVTSDSFVPPVSGSDKVFWQSSHPRKAKEQVRTVAFNVCNVAVDHTGELLMESVLLRSRQSRGRNLSSSKGSSKRENSLHLLTAFPSSEMPGKRISLLADSGAVALVHDLPAGDGKRSQLIQIAEISASNGAIESTEIFWEDGSQSGYFVFKKPRDSDGNIIELHVIPEYVIYNATESTILIEASSMRKRDKKIALDSHKAVSIKKEPGKGLLLTLQIPELDGVAGPVQVESVGMRICPINKKGDIVGSLAIQTVVGDQDAHLVVRVGQMELSRLDSENTSSSKIWLVEDVLRLRVRSELFEVTLVDSSPSKLGPESTLGPESNAGGQASQSNLLLLRDDSTGHTPTQNAELSEVRLKMAQEMRSDIALFHCSDFALDFQRSFVSSEKYGKKKEEVKGSSQSTELSQLFLTVQEMAIKDCDSLSKHPIVFTSTASEKFLDLTVLFEGPLNASIVRVGLVDLYLGSCSNKGSCGTLVIDSSEDFVWRLFDVMHRKNVALLDLACYESEDVAGSQRSPNKQIGGGEIFNPPSVRLFHFKTVRISEFMLRVSFRRRPEASRYKDFHDPLLNYFARQLKFSLKNADLFFAQYLQANIKGPLDFLFSCISAVYSSRLKYKWLKIITAVKFEDWATLAGRTSEEEEFVHGDLSRTAGMLAGQSVGYAFKAAGHAIGSTVQAATEKVGMGGLGKVANHVFSGVGTGAGTIFAGAGRGAGQVLGGVEGGATRIGAGLIRGLRRGRAGSVRRGLRDGAELVSSGARRGADTVARGTVSGVQQIAQGLGAGVNIIFQALREDDFRETFDSQYQGHGYRWINLTIFSFVIMSNTSMCTTFLSIGATSPFNFEGREEMTKLLTFLLFPIMFAPGTVLARYLVCSRSVKCAVLVGALLTAGGGFLRWLSSLPLIRSSARVPLVFAGQIMVATGHPGVINSVGLVAANWFKARERVVAVTVSSTAALLAAAAGQLAPRSVVANSDKNIPVLTNVLLFNFLYGAASAFVALFFLKNSPPNHPSRSTALRDSCRRMMLRVGSTDHDTSDASISLARSDAYGTICTQQSDQLTSSFSGEGWRETAQQIRMLAKERCISYLFLSFALGPMAVFSFVILAMFILLSRCDYSLDVQMESYGIFFGSGVFSTVIICFCMVRYQKYFLFLKTGSTLVVFAVLSLKVANIAFMYGTTALLGFVSIPLLPVFIQITLESTYPFSEDVSVSALLFVGYTIVGIPVALIFKTMIPKQGEFECNSNPNWSHATIFLAMAAFASTVLACHYRGAYKRTKNDLTTGLDEEEPLLNMDKA